MTQKKSSFKNLNNYWETNLFSEIFLKRDLNSHFPEWSSQEVNESFKKARAYLETSVDLKNFQSRNEDDTIDIIIELLALLEWHDGSSLKRDVILKNTCFVEELETDSSGKKNKLYKPDLLILDKPGQRRSVNPSLKEYDREAAEKFGIVPIEAKYWGRLKSTDSNGKLKVDKTREQDRDSLSLQPNQQIQKYMHVLGKEWGILTDGATWRLFNSLDSNGEDVYFEFKLDLWIYDTIAYLTSKDPNKAEEIRLLEAYKYFFFFFRKQSFQKQNRTPSFLQKIQSNTRKYVRDLELDLSQRFLAAMSSACNGYLTSVPSTGLAAGKKKLIQDTCESLLFNLLFIRSCETVGVLKTQVPPYSKHAIEPIIEAIGVFKPEHGKDNITELTESFQNFFDVNYSYKPNATDLYQYLLENFRITKTGMGSFFKGFRESLFSQEEQKFADTHKLSNECVVKILFSLSYDISKTYQDESGEFRFQQIAYNTLKPRQLGSIYESFLDYELTMDQENNRQLKGGIWSKTRTTAPEETLVSVMKPNFANKNTFYFIESETSERKSSGSYYTPDFIVDYIVNEVFEPQLNFSDPNSVLSMSVCDPAVGSGHFLGAAMRQLASSFEKTYIEKNNAGLELSRREVLTMVLEKCIYGVDLNQRAIKLAKMALWLETATPGMHLVNLDKSLLVGNSLYSTFNWEAQFKKVFDTGGFNAIVANPPYLGEKYNQEVFENIRKNPIFSGLHERRSNSYYYFTMLMPKILKPGGFAGEIIPIEWESNRSASKMRTVLDSQTVVLSKVRFQKLKVFKSNGRFVGTSSMILTFQNKVRDTGKATSDTMKVTLSGSRLQELIDKESLSSNQLKLLSSGNLARNSAAASKRFLNSTGAPSKNLAIKVQNSQIDESKSFGTKKESKEPLGNHFHVDQGIVTGADLVTKKNKFIDENWRKFEDQKNLGILILKLGIDISFKGKTGFINLGTAESKSWAKLNTSELENIKPLYKNKDIGEFGQLADPTSYVIFFKDAGKKNRPEWNAKS